MKRMMLVIMATALAIPGIAEAQNVTVSPESISLNLTLGENTSVTVNLTNNDAVIYDDVSFDSEYVLSYEPLGAHLDPGVPKDFTLTIGVLEYERPPNATGSMTVAIDEDIEITAYNETEKMQLGEIALAINLSLLGGLVERDYFFKKCFIEGSEEFCAEFNITELQNITVINETVENLSYNILMPYNVTKDFLEEYAETLRQAAQSIRESKESIREASNASITLQQRQNNVFRNAFSLESYLKSPTVPLWVEVAPSNFLKNMTGLSDEELMEAMNMLFQENKLSQKTEKEIIAIPIQSGVMTQEIQKVYVASTERIASQGQTEVTVNAVIFSALIVIVVMLCFIFYSFVWKRRVVL